MPAHPTDARAVNWALVADASLSMRIPIIDEERFREIVRAGGAHEVLVDGVAVWQFHQPIPEDVKASSPDALGYVARALHSVVEQLDNADRFSLVACAETAVVLVPATRGNQRAALVHGINNLKTSNLGEKTDLARGMQLGLDELRQGRQGSEPHSERILLLTDGFTQNPDACLRLARRAAAEGVSINTIGLGGDFQEDLLTRMADMSGGSAAFLRNAQEIPRAVAHELAAMRAVAAPAVALTIEMSQGVALRRATRIVPTLAALVPEQPAPASCTLHLGDLEADTPTRVLLELLVPPHPHHATPPAQTRLARLTLSSGQRGEHTIPHDLVARYAASPPPPLPAVHDAILRSSAMYLQQKAFDAAANGDPARASQLLQAVAARLRELGSHDMAETVLREAESLGQTGQTTPLGTKELTYLTRRLGQQES